MWHWLRDLVFSLFCPDGVYRVKRVTDLPDTCLPEVVYVIGEGRHEWVAAFVCPCGCQEIIQLNLQADSRPRWQVREHWNGTVSLSPSVRRIRGCHSHFWVQNGVVQWCLDDPRSGTRSRTLETHPPSPIQ